MTWRLSRWTWPALAASLAYALAVGAEWNERLVQRPVHGQILAAQASGDDDQDPQVRGSVFQNIRKTGAVREAEYGFVNFNRDKLRVSYRIDDAAFKRYNNDYGYRSEDIEALRQWRDNAIQSAFKLAVKQGKGQAAVDAAAANLQKEYEKRLRDYLEDRGFRLEKGNVTRIDMPLVVKKNGPQIKPLAETFQRIATQRGYRSMDIIGSVLSFAQTAVKYRQPDDLYKGKHTGGILPPITTVVLGWGDCDTKTAMVASLLSNWSQMRMVGLSVPGHYLMAILQIPDKGDMFVEYQGLQYVLLEPAGPAWLPPGHVGDDSVALLNGSDGYKIYPFF